MFFLFAGDNYYPSGGMDDYRGAYPTLDEAKDAAANLRVDWWHVATIEDGQLTEITYGDKD